MPRRDYAAAGKPACDFDDAEARVVLVDALTRNGLALRAVLEGRDLSEAVTQAAGLLATVLGQDLEQSGDGRFVIARRVAKDRVISTVDPQTRQGHKATARGFDGYQGHVAVDPDSKVITATEVSAGNAAAAELIGDLFDKPTVGEDPAEEDTARAGEVGRAGTGGDERCVYRDNAYGTGELHDRLERAGIESTCRAQAPVGAGGRFTKERFDVDLDVDTVTCPAGRTGPIRRGCDGVGAAHFGPACAGCPLLREQWTTSAAGRTVQVGIYERQLAAARARQQHPDWVADYRATGPRLNARSLT